MNNFALLMCGGFGSRLWPSSRKTQPKPFIKFNNKNSLFQKTLDRVLKSGITNIVIVTNRDHKIILENDLSLDVYKSLKLHIILEPESKNTAAAIFAGISYIRHLNKANIIVNVFSCDHLISPQYLFNKALKKGQKFINDNKAELNVYGIKPYYPETGYGYIKFNENLVQKFIEKPNYAQSKKFIKNDKYLWNIGIFSFQADKILHSYKALLPKTFLNIDVNKFTSQQTKNLKFIYIPDKMYGDIENISFDYAIVENIKDISVVKCDFEWNDVGSWSSMDKLFKKTKSNNNFVSKKVHSYQTKNCSVFGTDRLTALVGLENIVVVNSNDAILIADKNSTQDVKHIYQLLKNKDKRFIESHSKVFRPWGFYDVIAENDLFKIKKIYLNPKSSISYQFHNYRNEHWVILSGVATIIKDNQQFKLKKSESTYIEKKIKHRIINDQKIPLEIIEIQTGEYLGEDDIVRLNDQYGRDK